MKIISLLSVTLLLCVSLPVSAKSAFHCYVIGDTSKNKSGHPPGSQQNPYGSLAAVQADADCEVINVLYSSTPLDGGISLEDDQRLEGKKGRGGELPLITNTDPVSNGGVGVLLAMNNTIKHLHIMDTWGAGVAGIFYHVNPVGGDILIQGVVITGANQSEGFDVFGNIIPSLGIAAEEDMTLTIKNSEIGEANAPSIAIGQFDRHADIRISNTTVRDQGHISDGASEVSSGIAVTALGISSVDVKIVNTSVSNIGDDVLSNSDGLLLAHFGSGNMTAMVDGYRYSNPEGKGAQYSSTGIEMGCLGAAAVGCTFDGTVINSVIEDAFLAGIQVVDAQIGGPPGSDNVVTADIRDNEISGSLFGISSLTYMPFGERFLHITGNTIENSVLYGMLIETYESEVTEVFIEDNSIINSGHTGLLFAGDSPIGVLIDAGLGGLGSAGKNRIIDSGVNDILVDGVAVSAADNWWGSDSGPASVIEINGGSADVEPFLASDPNS